VRLPAFAVFYLRFKPLPVSLKRLCFVWRSVDAFLIFVSGRCGVVSLVAGLGPALVDFPHIVHDFSHCPGVMNSPLKLDDTESPDLRSSGVRVRPGSPSGRKSLCPVRNLVAFLLRNGWRDSPPSEERNGRAHRAHANRRGAHAAREPVGLRAVPGVPGGGGSSGASWGW